MQLDVVAVSRCGSASQSKTTATIQHLPPSIFCTLDPSCKQSQKGLTVEFASLISFDDTVSATKQSINKRTSDAATDVRLEVRYDLTRWLPFLRRATTVLIEWPRDEANASKSKSTTAAPPAVVTKAVPGFVDSHNDAMFWLGSIEIPSPSLVKNIRLRMLAAGFLSPTDGTGATFTALCPLPSLEMLLMMMHGGGSNNKTASSLVRSGEEEVVVATVHASSFSTQASDAKNIRVSTGAENPVCVTAGFLVEDLADSQESRKEAHRGGGGGLSMTKTTKTKVLAKLERKEVVSTNKMLIPAVALVCPSSVFVNKDDVDADHRSQQKSLPPVSAAIELSFGNYRGKNNRNKALVQKISAFLTSPWCFVIGAVLLLILMVASGLKSLD